MKFKIGERQIAIPPGEYEAVLLEVKELLYMKRKTLALRFEVKSGAHHGAIANAFINAHYSSFSPHTKLYKWFSLVNKDILNTGDEFDLDVFKNKVLKVKLETKTSKRTGNPFSNVTEILGVIRELE